MHITQCSSIMSFYGQVVFFCLQDLRSYHNSTVVGPGTVCLFKAGYASIVPSTVRVEIPPESCGIPALQSTGEIFNMYEMWIARCIS